MISLIPNLKFNFFDLDFKVQQREVSILKFDLDYSIVSDIIKEIHHYPSLTDDATRERARPPIWDHAGPLMDGCELFFYSDQILVDICVHMVDFDSNPIADSIQIRIEWFFLVLGVLFFGSFSIQILEFFDQWVLFFLWWMCSWNDFFWCMWVDLGVLRFRCMCSWVHSNGFQRAVCVHGI